MIRLTEDMTRLINRARDDGYPCIVATASADGTPNAGYIGTVAGGERGYFGLPGPDDAGAAGAY